MDLIGQTVKGTFMGFVTVAFRSREGQALSNPSLPVPTRPFPNHAIAIAIAIAAGFIARSLFSFDLTFERG